MAKQVMNIETISFLTELTDEDASHINGGYFQDISYDLLYTANSMYGGLANLYNSIGYSDLGDFWGGMYATPVYGTDFGGTL